MALKTFITPTGLQEKETKFYTTTNPVLKAIAVTISYIFHPVFVPLYVLAFLLFVEPFIFIGATMQEKILTLGRAFVNYTFFPLISVLLLKGLGLISSIQLKDRKDRIIPFIICNIWYFWIWYVWRGLPGAPHYLVVFALGVFLASSLGLLANIYIKISMHGIAVGTAITFLILLTINPASPNLTTYLGVSLLAAGVIGTSRLLLGAHTPKEYYVGLLIGAMTIIIASWLG